MLETVKAHPYITAGVVVGGGIILYMLTSSGSSASSENPYGGGAIISGPTAEQVAAGTALQSMQYEAQDRQNQRLAELQALELQAGAAVTVAELDANSKFNLAELTTQLLMYQTDKSAQNELQISTLEAGVANRQTDLEAFRVTEASKNTSKALDYQFGLSSAQQLYDFAVDKKTLKNENKANKRGNKTVRKVSNNQVKVAKVGADVAKQNSTNNLLSNVIGGIFGVAKTAVTGGAAMPRETKKPNNKRRAA